MQYSLYMVKKYLVDNNHHHQMISNLCYKVFVVYSYFVEKMGNFHYNPVKGEELSGKFTELVNVFGRFQ